jgi:hypothetical protein
VKRETRYDYAAAVAMRYQRSSREQKGWILDEFCAATGYNRKYAIKLLHGPFPRAARLPLIAPYSTPPEHASCHRQQLPRGSRGCYELKSGWPVESGHGGWESEAVPDGCDG